MANVFFLYLVGFSHNPLNTFPPNLGWRISLSPEYTPVTFGSDLDKKAQMKELFLTFLNFAIFNIFLNSLGNKSCIFRWLVSMSEYNRRLLDLGGSIRSTVVD